MSWNTHKNFRITVKNTYHKQCRTFRICSTLTCGSLIFCSYFFPTLIKLLKSSTYFMQNIFTFLLTFLSNLSKEWNVMILTFSLFLILWHAGNLYSTCNNTRLNGLIIFKFSTHYKHFNNSISVENKIHPIIFLSTTTF